MIRVIVGVADVYDDGLSRASWNWKTNSMFPMLVKRQLSPQKVDKPVTRAVMDF
jgi:hypothetical protein